MSAYRNLKQKLLSDEARVGVVGLGYVGLPLASALHGGGLRVLGFDVDERKIEMLERGEAYLEHLGAQMSESLAQSSRFSATRDFARLGEADVIAVCVPTPLGRHREPDLGYVLDSARQIGRSLREGQLVVLESTTYPRTTRDEFLPAMLEEARARGEKLRCGEDFFVAFSPEREDPGRKSHDTTTIPKLVGGLDPRSTELAALLYRKGVEQVVEVSSAEVAESAKLLENIFRSVNIALVNELKTILNRMQIDVWEVVDAASTKPFGFMPFFPGPGLGGHCIPIDPFYLTWKAREYGISTRFIELAGEVNRAMPAWVVDKVAAVLNEAGKPLKGSRILILGLAYKPGVDDMRESPSLTLIDQLLARGAEVAYHDPYLPVIPASRRHPHLAGRRSTPPAGDFDCFLLATHHDCYDDALTAHGVPIVDTRRVLADHPLVTRA